MGNQKIYIKSGYSAYSTFASSFFFNSIQYDPLNTLATLAQQPLPHLHPRPIL